MLEQKFCPPVVKTAKSSFSRVLSGKPSSMEVLCLLCLSYDEYALQLLSLRLVSQDNSCADLDLWLSAPALVFGSL